MIELVGAEVEVANLSKKSRYGKIIKETPKKLYVQFRNGKIKKFWKDRGNEIGCKDRMKSDFLLFGGIEIVI